MKNAFIKLSLIGGLMSWCGFAGAVSSSELLSGLRGMGLLGFQPGTILKQDVGDSFIDAVRREDALLLQKRIHDRLNGPFVDFMKDLHAVDEKGRNVFHALAEVKDSQPLFADIAESLIRISGFHTQNDRQNAEIIEVANMVISPELRLEKTPLIKAIREAESNSVVLKEVEKFIAENTAVTVISYLHGKTSPLLGLSGALGEGVKEVVEFHGRRKTFLTLLLTRNPDPAYDPPLRLLEGVNIHQPHFMRDSQDFLPIDIAKKSGNLPVFSILYEHSGELTFLAPLISGILTAPVIAVGVHSLEHGFEKLAFGTVVAFGGVALMFGCHKAFSKLPVFLNKYKFRKSPASAALEKSIGP